ncbi:unnamed protein product [Allacma fusca]|uniref:Uncharacterized protein n=1 Tax=Allacma fusca TaxID=39272 RepID=A0A8J2P571_9HEXA|nr:unnamed protein product [Allacma fusca]
MSACSPLTLNTAVDIQYLLRSITNNLWRKILKIAAFIKTSYRADVCLQRFFVVQVKTNEVINGPSSSSTFSGLQIMLKSFKRSKNKCSEPCELYCSRLRF